MRPVMHDLDLRRTNRYRLAAPVNFWWPSLDGAVQASEGMTRDISSSGLMVLAEKCPPVGAHVQLRVLVSRSSNNPVPLELHGEGLVIRVEYGMAAPLRFLPAGFAASVLFHQERSSGSDFVD